MSRIAQLMVVLALAAVFAVSTVSAILCYECIPTPLQDCSDKNDFDTKDCGDGNYCRKMIQNVQGKVNYVLQCGRAEGGMKKPTYHTANDYVKANVYHCNDKDRCNSADSATISKLAAVAVLAVAWMLH